MFHIRFTYVSFMFHICFYLRLDIVYVYVMPRPPSIETIPGAPLDQPKFYVYFCILAFSCQLFLTFAANPRLSKYLFCTVCRGVLSRHGMALHKSTSRGTSRGTSLTGAASNASKPPRLSDKARGMLEELIAGYCGSERDAKLETATKHHKTSHEKEDQETE